MSLNLCSLCLLGESLGAAGAPCIHSPETQVVAHVQDSIAGKKFSVLFAGLL